MNVPSLEKYILISTQTTHFWNDFYFPTHLRNPCGFAASKLASATAEGLINEYIETFHKYCYDSNWKVQLQLKTFKYLH
jgi:hypothetical protein